MNHAKMGYHGLYMKTILLFLLVLPMIHMQQAPKTWVPLLREGSKVVEGIGTLSRESDSHPIVIELPRGDGKTIDTFIVLPNQRLAEMEASTKEFPDRSFRISGSIYAYGDQNYLLIREVVSIGEHTERIHPTIVPTNPNKENVEQEDYKDSVADIVSELEDATGSLVRSIRNASTHPINKETVKEGARISARRCHLIRNKHGAWVAVFVSDATGLSDPPCTVLPSTSFASLTRWAKTQEPSTPVLLSGEVLNYHGHGFLLVSSWRTVHNTDHLNN